MNIIKEGLDFFVNKNWKTIITTYEFILHDLQKFTDNKKGGTLIVCPILSYVTQQNCYLVVAIDRPNRTIICTTTLGDEMDNVFFHNICNLKDKGHLFACVALRLKCEKNHEAFVIYLGDMFTNGKFNPVNRILSDAQILQQYNINIQMVQQHRHQQSNNHHYNYHNREDFDRLVKQWNDTNTMLSNTRGYNGLYY